MKYRNKLMALVEVFKRRLSRYRESLLALEHLVNKNAASPNQKQQYVELKAKKEELEDMMDLITGIVEQEDN